MSAHPSSPRTAHIVGAGLAGLAAALDLAEAGFRVRLYEAAPRAGGRCRSFHDDAVGCVIDNGGHMLLTANRAAMAYLDRIGARDELIEVKPAAFPFVCLKTGDAWVLRPNPGPIPWWVLSPDRRVAGTTAFAYLDGWRLMKAGPTATVAETVRPEGLLYTRLWEPLVTAVANTPPSEAAAQPIGRMLKLTFGEGETACRPCFARRGLSLAFVDPALAKLEARGAEIRFSARVDRLELEAERVAALVVAGERVEVGSGDAVVLAVPPAAAAALVPNLTVPSAAHAIVNAHFRLDRPVTLPGGFPFLGLINATAQWLIQRDDLISVTVSAGDVLAERDADSIAQALWADVALVCGLPAKPLPRVRVIKEKRATFAETPANERLRPDRVTDWENLVLAGDWTNTGLPATIESAITSGFAAAAVLT